jgi:choline-sulfatase
MNKQLFILVWSVLATAALAATETEKPNVMFIFADDQTFETIGAYGLTEVITPNLDRLVERGISFTHAYNMGAWNGAVCVASRAMLNSGAFVNRAQEAIVTNTHWSELMKGAGYTTYMTGKWHVPGEPRFDVVKDVRPGMPKDDRKTGYNRPLDEEDYKRGWKPWETKHGGFWEGGTHWTQVVADNTLDFLEQTKSDDNPFFMYLAFNAPHDPRQAPKEYVEMYPLDSIQVPKNFLPEYPYAEAICGKQLRDERLMPYPRTDYAVKVNRQEYYASITYMDAQIGRMLDALEASGKADNTYIIFTADHGLAVGHHGLVGKQNMYEHSMRPPFIVVGPGLKANRTISTPIYLQDAMATALDLAGVEKPAHVEFKSLLPMLNGDSSVHYDSIYGKYIEKQRMIIQGDWKLIFYPFAEKPMRLFNLKRDPLEMNDRVDHPECASLVSELRAKFIALQRKMGDELDLDNPVKPEKRKGSGEGGH